MYILLRFCVFFRNPKNMTFTFFELLHTFSRTLVRLKMIVMMMKIFSVIFWYHRVRDIRKVSRMYFGNCSLYATGRQLTSDVATIATTVVVNDRLSLLLHLMLPVKTLR